MGLFGKDIFVLLEQEGRVVLVGRERHGPAERVERTAVTRP